MIKVQKQQTQHIQTNPIYFYTQCQRNSLKRHNTVKPSEHKGLKFGYGFVGKQFFRHVNGIFWSFCHFLVTQSNNFKTRRQTIPAPSHCSVCSVSTMQTILTLATSNKSSGNRLFCSLAESGLNCVYWLTLYLTVSGLPVYLG